MVNDLGAEVVRIDRATAPGDRARAAAGPWTLEGLPDQLAAWA
ncbi:hypothetical protein [Nocardioides marmoriginsengisoli]|nr:hypothetical protein [Nocardioides marmoriginsengisoli]